VSLRHGAALACAALAVLAPPAQASLRVLGPFGSGADQAWLVVPAGRVRSVVVFAHGWKQFPPSPEDAWVAQFRPWLDHLASRGSAVIFPRYQLGGADAFGPMLVEAFRRGVATGFARLGRLPLPAVAVGYSAGGSLVFSYGANARRWRLPVPAAIMSVFPAGMVPGAALPRLSRQVRVLIQVGDRDDVAGTGGADAFWRWLGGRPTRRRRYEVVRSRPGFVADHAAPKTDAPAARQAFWRPLDELIGEARQGTAYARR
jgi:hypothetical protein